MHLDEVAPDGQLLLVLTLLYRIAGFALIAAALGYAALAIGGVTAGLFWAKAVMLVMALVVGLPVGIAGYRAEVATTVVTPWRAVFGLTGAAVLAFVLSVM